MATGVAGSTLTGELNRLANGGTYPVYTAYKAPQGAANAWAGTTGKGLIAALNYIVSASRQRNELAGTSGLSAVVALRSINL